MGRSFESRSLRLTWASPPCKAALSKGKRRQTHQHGTGREPNGHVERKYQFILPLCLSKQEILRIIMYTVYRRPRDKKDYEIKIPKVRSQGKSTRLACGKALGSIVSTKS